MGVEHLRTNSIKVSTRRSVNYTVRELHVPLVSEVINVQQDGKIQSFVTPVKPQSADGEWPFSVFAKTVRLSQEPGIYRRRM